ncbi:LEC14B protein [Apiospora kogelbergensis]|uniref:LEC14B protein n=1 Tax=Apiospora kogelbergensis TaxID=1337665 RepID=UPI00312E55E4
MSSRSESEDNIHQRYADLFHDAQDEHDENADPDYENEQDEFHDAEEGGEDDEDEEDEEDDDEDDDEDDEDDDDDVRFLVEVEGDEDEDDGEAAGAGVTMQQRLIRLVMNNQVGLSQAQVITLLRNSNLGHLIFSNDDDDEDLQWGRRRRRRTLDPDRFPKYPSEEGQELMNSGKFGATELAPAPCGPRSDWRVAYSTASSSMMKQWMLPTTDAEMVIKYQEPVYSGQFSDDGNFFYSCVKDFQGPHTVSFLFGSWTLTDASLSPDNKWLAYTSIQSNVCLAPTDPNDTGDPYTLNLASPGPGGNGWHSAFGIWSIRFSGDGRELVAGTNADSIVVYDIESRRVLHQIRGHENHVNAVCFADKQSPHILYSGSDDTTIKVWDRRSMGNGREAGAFVGHIEGLTYIDSKGDGRYILSNGKDQSMKLWDLRKMYTSAQFTDLDPTQHTRLGTGFDYRWESYDDTTWFPHPNDNSVVTFRGGHKILRTLIRCHFSPPGSTDSRYVYTGSHDGKVYIYNLDGTPAGDIDVQEATLGETLPRNYRPHRHRGQHHRGGFTCVRDAAWHPNAPFIAASALNGGDHSIGTVSVHSFNESRSDEAEPRMGLSFNDKLRPVGDHSNIYDDEMEEEFGFGFGRL